MAQGLVDGAKAFFEGGNSLTLPANATLTERIPLRFMDSDSLANKLQPVIAKGGSLAGASVQPNPKDNSLVVQGTPEAVADLKQIVRMLDVESRAVMVKIGEVRDGKAGSYSILMTADNTTASLTFTGGITANKVRVTPHLNGDGKTASLSLTLNAEKPFFKNADKPFFKKIPLGEETKLETPFGIYLVTVTEEKDGSNDPK